MLSRPLPAGMLLPLPGGMLLPLPACMLLPLLCGCVAAPPGRAAPGPPPIESITHPDERAIVDAFLAHTRALPQRLEPDDMAAFAVEPEAITWQTVPYLRMALIAWRLTGETQYLDILADGLDQLFGAMNEGPGGGRGWFGLALELFRHPDHPERAVPVMITDLSVAGFVAEVLDAVQDDPALDAYRQRAEGWLAIVERDLLPRWLASERWHDLGERGAVLSTWPELKPEKADLTQPHNKHAKIVHSLLELYKATGNPDYARRAVQVGTRFKRSLTFDGERYTWHYWDPAGTWDVMPGEPNKWKHWIGAEHRPGYHSLTSGMAAELYDHGLVFDREDLARFARTQAEVCWNGSVAESKWFRVDGRPVDQTWLSGALVRFDPRLAEVAFSAAARAERLARKDHPWQGGVSAAGWIEDRFLTPAGDAARHADALAPFLADPEQRAFVERLAFEVTAPGYQAPATPAEMER